MNLFSTITLEHEQVNPDSIELLRNGDPVSFQYLSELNQVQPNEPGSALDVFDVTYCTQSDPPGGDIGAHESCIAGEFVPKSTRVVGIYADPSEGSRPSILANLASRGITPIVYSAEEIETGKPISDGVNALILTRVVVVSSETNEFVQGVRDYLFLGGSLLAEYDAAAMVFETFDGVNPAFVDKFSESISIYEGNSAGGGLVLPVSSSITQITDSTHPIFGGLGGEWDTGLRAGFAVTDFDSDWLEVSATFTSVGFGGLVPAGTYPAVLSGRCGSGRVAVFMMNYLTANQNTAQVYQVVDQTLNWIVGL